MNYYQILGVSENATQVEIKRAYKRLAMKYHPDRVGDDKEKHEKFKEIQNAYSVLSDEAKRAQYDRFGEAGVNAGPGGFGGGFHGGFQGDFGDIFGDIFNDVFGGGARGRPQRGRDIQVHVELSLEEAVFGTSKEIHIATRVPCSYCEGTGSEDGNTQTCETCGGHGRVRLQQGMFSVQQTCPRCQGSGRMYINPCQHCGGEGRRQETRKLAIKVPAGVDTGDRIRLSGEGEAGPLGAPAGDLFVDVRVMPHPLFERHGDDLFCEMPIRFATACLGGELEVPTLDKPVNLKVPEGTQTGKVFRLRGKGVKSVRSHRTGDLLCKVVVETPVNLSAEQKQLIRQLDESLSKKSKQHSPKSSSWLDSVKGFFEKVKSA